MGKVWWTGTGYWVNTCGTKPQKGNKVPNPRQGPSTGVRLAHWPPAGYAASEKVLKSYTFSMRELLPAQYIVWITKINLKSRNVATDT